MVPTHTKRYLISPPSQPPPPPHTQKKRQRIPQSAPPSLQLPGSRRRSVCVCVMGCECRGYCSDTARSAVPTTLLNQQRQHQWQAACHTATPPHRVRLVAAQHLHTGKGPTVPRSHHLMGAAATPARASAAASPSHAATRAPVRSSLLLICKVECGCVCAHMCVTRATSQLPPSPLIHTPPPGPLTGRPCC